MALIFVGSALKTKLITFKIVLYDHCNSFCGNKAQRKVCPGIQTDIFKTQFEKILTNRSLLNVDFSRRELWRSLYSNLSKSE